MGAPGERILQRRVSGDSANVGFGVALPREMEMKLATRLRRPPENQTSR
jgi:hypothetical protein